MPSSIIEAAQRSRKTGRAEDKLVGEGNLPAVKPASPKLAMEKIRRARDKLPAVILDLLDEAAAGRLTEPGGRP
jgi:hypothetical protein